MAKDNELAYKMELAIHGIIRAMNFDRLPVQRENGVFSPKNLSFLELRILRTIDEGGRIPLRDIRADVDVPNSTLTSIIQKFERKGLIDRLTDPADRRSYILTITEKGRVFNQAHRSMDHLMAEEMLRRIGDPEKAEEFIRIVSRCVQEPLFSVEDFKEWQDSIARSFR